MKNFSSLLKYGPIYAKNYFLESLAICFPKISLFTPKPLYLGLSVGTVCNFQCRHCDLWQLPTKAGNYLTLEQIKKILKDLRKWLGPFRLTFTGAEPFIRKDMIEILEFASENDIYTIITSNGFLIDKGLAKEIVDSGLDAINISLDGINSKTHDFLRRKKDAFNRAIKALNFLIKLKGKTPSVYINTVIMKPNVDQLVDLVKLAKKLRVDGIRFQALESKYLFGNNSYNPFWFKKEPLWPKDRQRLSGMINELRKMKKQDFPIKNTIRELEELKLYYQNPLLLAKKQRCCFTGVRNFAIDEYGKVKLCFGMRPVGDLLKESPQEIWYGEKAEKLRLIIANCQRACRILPCNKRENLSQIITVLLRKLKNK